jgi:hypothetical protein
MGVHMDIKLLRPKDISQKSIHMTLLTKHAG